MATAEIRLFWPVGECGRVDGRWLWRLPMLRCAVARRDTWNTEILGELAPELGDSHPFRHTLAVQWRRNGMKIETISQMLGHRSLRMTMRYAAVMPETLRHEFDQAFAAIDEEHRGTAQVRVLLSPAAHLAASTQWRESLWVDLGIGFCGLSAYLPCDSRLACLPCPNYIEKREHLPVFQQQRSNLLELRMLGDEVLPAARKDELDGALEALDRRIGTMGAQPTPTS